MKLHPVELERLTPEILHVFGRQPPLLTAGDKTGLNTMTIGWCQLGRLWNLPVCTVYVRPERYTYQFMESHDYFTVSILPEEAKKVTALCGSKSGRDMDKVKACGLTVRWGAGDAPFFDEAECNRRSNISLRKSAGSFSPCALMSAIFSKSRSERHRINFPFSRRLCRTIPL